MKFLIITFTFLTVLQVLTLQLASASTLIHAGYLIDGKSQKIVDNVTIVIDGNKIVSVNAGFTQPKNILLLIV